MPRNRQKVRNTIFADYDFDDEEVEETPQSDAPRPQSQAAEPPAADGGNAGDDSEWDESDGTTPDAEAATESDGDYGDEDDDEGVDLPGGLANTAQNDFIDSHPEFYESYDYEEGLVPRIPEAYRGADVIGLRTRANGNEGVPMKNPNSNTAKWEAAWARMTYPEKYIMLLVSEHRHLTVDQIYTMLALSGVVIKSSSTDVMRALARQRLIGETGEEPTKEEVEEAVRADRERRAANGTMRNPRHHDSMKTYALWLFRDRYGIPVTAKEYKQMIKPTTAKGLLRSINRLVKAGMLDEITPAYKMKEDVATETFQSNPSLFMTHYYLSPDGGATIAHNTAMPKKGVGYVPSHYDASFMSIVHETECTECLLSVIRCAQYLSNIEILNYDAMSPDEIPKVGYVDILRCYHEKDCEYKGINWQGSDGRKGIDFKSDGMVSIYSSKLHAFVDLFLEYDAGSSKESNLSHKVEAYIKYVMTYSEILGDSFRRPVLLLVTQKPSAFMPQMLTKRKTTLYTNAIKRRIATKQFDGIRDDLDDIACILITDCNMLRQHGALGACWRRMDPVTGLAEERAHDLLTAVRGFVSG